MIIAGYLGARMSSGKWVADIFDHPSLGLDSAVSQPLLKGMLLRGYASATSRIAGRLLKKADIVLCTLVPEALDGYGIPQSRLVPLTNGIDLHAAGEGRGGLQKGHRSRRFRVLYVGFVLRVRGINEILDAADALRQKYPDLEWVLAGKSNAGEQDWLKMEMDRRKLPGTVTFLGELSHGDVLELVQMSDVCLFTFPRTATTDFIYPVKIFEYMAYGKPIVATSLKGVQQILEHGKNGLLVRPGDAKALAAAVEELYLNRELGERLGNAARKNAPKYDWREINRQVVSVLERSAVGHQIHS
jgi:glycosyltransferase involved in cell wall biosynthesis